MGFRTVFVKNGEKLKVNLDNLEVLKEGHTYMIPLADIESVILEGDQTVVTTRLLAKFAQHHIDTVICDNTFMPAGVFLGVGQYHRSAKRAIWQSNWTEEQKQLAWCHIVTQKIQNQIAVAKYLGTDAERIEVLEKLSEGILPGDTTNREGHVAKVYFNSLYGVGFTREEECLPNACMNYGYAVIRAQMARCVVALGLLPMLGIFHKNEYNSFNLVDDLMEPFRPLMDWYIHQTVLKNKEKYLTYHSRLTLVEFLHQKIKVKNKKIYMNQAMSEYVAAFVKAMETADFENVQKIHLENMLECEGK
ncbi:type II CRISPR-associated endonuclease Cas1 [Enterococcus faecalis]|nr:type II CRISPR-associated endonuclease Cas1 [Enterococcus faecalis]